MAEPTSCCAEPSGYCARVDTLFNLPGVNRPAGHTIFLRPRIEIRGSVGPAHVTEAVH
jgi:hypothetical protein